MRWVDEQACLSRTRADHFAVLRSLQLRCSYTVIYRGSGGVTVGLGQSRQMCTQKGASWEGGPDRPSQNGAAFAVVNPEGKEQEERLHEGAAHEPSERQVPGEQEAAVHLHAPIEAENVVVAGAAVPVEQAIQPRVPELTRSVVR